MKRPLRLAVLLAVSMFALAITTTAAGAAAAWTLHTPSAPSDIHYDELTGTLYVTSGTKVLRYRVATHQTLDPIQLGGVLGGIDQSADGRFLVVADRVATDGSIGFHLLDLIAGTSKRVSYPSSFDATGIHSVVFGSDGAVYSTVVGSNWHPVRRYNIASGTTVDILTVYGNTMLAASGDRRYIGIVTPLSPSGVDRFSVETYGIESARASNVHREIALSYDGQRIAVPGYQFCDFLNEGMSRIGRINAYRTGFPVGAAYSRPDRLWIMSWGNSGYIRVVDETGTILPAYWDANAFFSVPHYPYFDFGRVRVTSDGTLAFVTIPSGVRVLDRRPTVTIGTPAPATIRFGSTAVIKGTVPAGDSRVTLQSSRDNNGWTDSQTATSTGTVAFSVKPSGRTYYRLRYGGNGALVPGVSASRAVAVQALMGVPSTPSSIGRARYFTVSGSVAPAHSAAVRLYFDRYESGRWIRRKTLTTRASASSGGSTAGYSLQTKLDLAGTWRVRASHADAEHATSYSAYRTFKVR